MATSRARRLLATCRHRVVRKHRARGSAAATRAHLLLAAAAVAALAFAAAGCGVRAEPTGTSVRLYPVTVRGAGDRATTLGTQPRRIRALDRGIARSLEALGAGDRTVRSGAADLVVTWSTSDEATRAESFPGAVYVAPGETVGDVARSLAALGILVGDPVRGRELARHVESDARRARDRVRGDRRTSVFVDTSYFIPIRPQSLGADVVRLAGGIAVGTGGVGPVGASQLRRLDPDVYLATKESGTTLRALRKNRATRKLRAVRTGRFEVIPDSLFQPGPWSGAAALQIARILHPDAFR